MNSFVRAKAEQIVKLYGENSTVIPLDRLCKRLNIRFMHLEPEVDRDFIEAHYTGCHRDNLTTHIEKAVEGFAFLSSEGNKFIKVKFNKENVPHSRFVAAHEIGHHVLNHLEPGQMLMSERANGNIKHTSDVSAQEKLADEFARHLLVPLPTLSRCIMQYGITDKHRLAEIFLAEKSTISHQIDEWLSKKNPVYGRFVKARRAVAV